MLQEVEAGRDIRQGAAWQDHYRQGGVGWGGVGVLRTSLRHLLPSSFLLSAQLLLTRRPLVSPPTHLATQRLQSMELARRGVGQE